MSAQTTSSTNFSTDVKILKRAVAVQLVMGGRDTNVSGEITQSLHAGHRAQPPTRDWCY